MKLKVYIETSVISYLTARPSRDLITAAHQQLTTDWWEHRRTDFDLHVSQLVVREARAGDKNAASRRLEIIERIPLLELNDEALALAGPLLEDGPLPPKASDEALPMPMAAVHRTA